MNQPSIPGYSTLSRSLDPDPDILSRTNKQNKSLGHEECEHLTE